MDAQNPSSTYAGARRADFAARIRPATALKRAAYGLTQAARIAWFTGHYIAGRRMMGPLTAPGEAPYALRSRPLDRKRLRESFRELFRTDWRNIERGEYKMPLEIRRLPNLVRLALASRDYLRDARTVSRRRAADGHSEVLTGALADKYPRYFLQNFHFQTGGWLSEESAERYDMQVETLFTGSGGAMRRQALPEIRKAIGGRNPAAVSLLDLGCGAGRFLEEVTDNWPRLAATALDLSPAYLGKARRRLRRRNSIRFVEADAEATGLSDASYDIVTAVYLFHELPPEVRRAVAAEIARLLKPGGTFILVDTIQFGDEPGFDILLENFPRAVHEPYYESYCRENLAELFSGAGLDLVRDAAAFLSKISTFQRRDPVQPLSSISSARR